MKHWKKIRILLRAAAFLCVLTLALCAVDHVLMGKTGKFAVTFAYTREPGTVDVIYAGTSHVNCGFLPYELYERYGITSVNQAQTAQPIPMSYYAIKEMIELHHPRVVVLDLYYLYMNRTYSTTAYMHQSLDSMRNQRIRVSAILDLIPRETQVEMLLPFTLYHSRWTELTKVDFTQTSTWSGGASMVLDSVYSGDDPVFELLDPSDTKEPPELPLRYLEKVADLCRETGTELVLTVIPYRAWGTEQKRNVADDQRYYNWMISWCEERGIPLVNMLYDMDEMNFDLKDDMREWNHANYQGAVKITDYIGRYLTEHYDLPDRREDPSCACWNEELVVYRRHVSTDTENSL